MFTRFQGGLYRYENGENKTRNSSKIKGFRVNVEENEYQPETGSDWQILVVPRGVEPLIPA